MLSACFCMLMAACSSDDDEDGNGITLEVSDSEITLDESVDGTGIGAFSIKSNTRWVLTSHADWLSFTPAEGQGDQVIAVAAKRNNSVSDRIARIMVSSADQSVYTYIYVKVTQNSGENYIDSQNGLFTANGVSFKMITVPGGTFRMGASNADYVEENEQPAHNVSVSKFYIGETEVTQELWEAVMGSNPSSLKGAQLPVHNVSWDDCQEFINKLNDVTGLWFSLPTEAEWEFAARGGNKTLDYLYSGSNNIGDVAWYNENSGGLPHEVKTKQANELGIYDMSGNVMEWCQDWYGPNTYSQEVKPDPTGPESGMVRVLRGGRFNFVALDCRVSKRDSEIPRYATSSYGLRLALRMEP